MSKLKIRIEANLQASKDKTAGYFDDYDYEKDPVYDEDLWKYTDDEDQWLDVELPPEKPDEYIIEVCANCGNPINELSTEWDYFAESPFVEEGMPVCSKKCKKELEKREQAEYDEFDHERDEEHLYASLNKKAAKSLQDIEYENPNYTDFKVELANEMVVVTGVDTREDTGTRYTLDELRPEDFVFNSYSVQHWVQNPYK